VLRRMANAPDPQTDKLSLDASKLRIQITNECSLVEADGALGGKALKFSNIGWNWAATYNLSYVKFDPDASYRVRICARADLTGKEKNGAVLVGGIYDREGKKNLASSVKSASQIKNGWAWYDVGVIKPLPSQYLYVGAGKFDKKRFKVNPSHEALWVDQVEITRVDAK
jgi:hypothetical protein